MRVPPPRRSLHKGGRSQYGSPVPKHFSVLVELHLREGSVHPRRRPTHRYRARVPASGSGGVCVSMPLPRRPTSKGHDAGGGGRVDQLRRELRAMGKIFTLSLSISKFSGLLVHVLQPRFGRRGDVNCHSMQGPENSDGGEITKLGGLTAEAISGRGTGGSRICQTLPRFDRPHFAAGGIDLMYQYANRT